ncbi:nitroreductase family deazaflavin-dependent oxidoreductase [Winogradskya consettensis]|uniref:Nitroreductase family deazaflavin-dependent oxidoreductase n=1 Tax=Winogradskya consettensis TaxID=113560 RepID=A0A919SYM4_9ACTN|nr:nitroreductase family deazaflavin-dependent oxidoreductase [Actinoplanes consettensis]GIM81239.1 hypothetical protein Aco04nite_75570 [Actinoplanes consettensis]
MESDATATDFNQPVIDEFRAHGGRVGGMFEGATLALLTTTGARTGRRRSSPVGWVSVDGRHVVVASAGGAPANPSWYTNLVADPRLTVENGTDTYAATAEILRGQDRADLWDRVIAVAPGYADYQNRTAREIPLIVIRRQ